MLFDIPREPEMVSNRRPINIGWEQAWTPHLEMAENANAP
jgi:hypothetical protein